MSESAPEVASEAGDEQVEQTLAEAVAAPEQEPQDQQKEAKPDTGKAETDWQAEVQKWKSLARKHEQKAKDNADAARQWAEFEDSQKSEQQKLMERLEAAERELGEERRGRARLMAAAAHNIPASLLDRIGGSTEEEIAESAQALAAEIDAEVQRRLAATPPVERAPEPEPPRGSYRPVESLTPGAMPASQQPQDPNEIMRAFLSGQST
jgi:isopropylmalate/homocitrate/citramalate synthase